MSNKLIIPIIAALSVASISSFAFAQLYQVNKVNKSTVQISVSISSESATSSTSQARVGSGSSQVLSSSTVNVLSSVKVEEPKVESVPKVESAKSDDLLYSDMIKYISTDKTKLSKSIQQYINCPTKFLKNHYGAFVVENGQETYKCPPEIQTLGCRVNISYLQLPSKPSPLLFDEQNKPLYPEGVDLKNIISQLKTGWNCDLMFPLGSFSDGGATCAANKIANYIIEYAVDQTCYAIPKSIL